MNYPIPLNLVQIENYNSVYNTVNVKTSVADFLVVLRLNVPVNNFSVMSGRSHRFLGN